MNLLVRRNINYLFLPPYSPFFNPIEECFGSVKSACHRYYEEYQDLPLQDAIQNAFSRVTVAMIKGFYKHAGYE